MSEKYRTKLGNAKPKSTDTGDMTLSCTATEGCDTTSNPPVCSTASIPDIVRNVFNEVGRSGGFPKGPDGERWAISHGEREPLMTRLTTPNVSNVTGETLSNNYFYSQYNETSGTTVTPQFEYCCKPSDSYDESYFQHIFNWPEEHNIKKRNLGGFVEEAVTTGGGGGGSSTTNNVIHKVTAESDDWNNNSRFKDLVLDKVDSEIAFITSNSDGDQWTYNTITTSNTGEFTNSTEIEKIGKPLIYHGGTDHEGIWFNYIIDESYETDLVTNGTFDTNISSWTAQNSAGLNHEAIGGSINFDGNNDHINFPGSTEFTLGVGDAGNTLNDFTFEFWIHPNSTGGADNGKNQTIWMHDGPTLDNTGQFKININPSTKSLNIDLNNGANVIQGTIEVADSSWHHIAVTRNLNVFRLFIDGTLDGSVTSSYNMGDSLNSGAPRPRVGNWDGGSAGDYNGFLANLRIIKGEALYTANFTRPTSQVPITSNTVLYWANNPISGEIFNGKVDVSPTTPVNTSANCAQSSPYAAATLRILSSAQSTGSARQEITTVNGQEYTLSASYLHMGGDTPQILLGTTGGGSEVATINLASGGTNDGANEIWETITHTFTAKSSSTFIELRARKSGSVDGLVRFDNIKVIGRMLRSGTTDVVDVGDLILGDNSETNQGDFPPNIPVLGAVNYMVDIALQRDVSSSSKKGTIPGTLALNSVKDVNVGDTVSGSGIRTGTTITAVDPGLSIITLSKSVGAKKVKKIKITSGVTNQVHSSTLCYARLDDSWSGGDKNGVKFTPDKDYYVQKPEIFVNNTFSSGITGWETFTDSTQGGTIAVSGNNLRFTQGSNSVWLSIYQDIDTEVGKEYEFVLNVDSSNTDANWLVELFDQTVTGQTNTKGNSTNYASWAIGHPNAVERGEHKRTFIAVSTKTRIYIRQGGAAGVTGEISSVNLREYIKIKIRAGWSIKNRSAICGVYYTNDKKDIEYTPVFYSADTNCTKSTVQDDNGTYTLGTITWDDGTKLSNTLLMTNPTNESAYKIASMYMSFTNAPIDQNTLEQFLVEFEKTGSLMAVYGLVNAYAVTDLGGKKAISVLDDVCRDDVTLEYTKFYTPFKEADQIEDMLNQAQGAFEDECLVEEEVAPTSFEDAKDRFKQIINNSVSKSSFLPKEYYKKLISNEDSLFNKIYSASDTMKRTSSSSQSKKIDNLPPQIEGEDDSGIIFSKPNFRHLPPSMDRVKYFINDMQIGTDEDLNPTLDLDPRTTVNQPRMVIRSIPRWTWWDGGKSTSEKDYDVGTTTPVLSGGQNAEITITVKKDSNGYVSKIETNQKTLPTPSVNTIVRTWVAPKPDDADDNDKIGARTAVPTETNLTQNPDNRDLQNYFGATLAAPINAIYPQIIWEPNVNYQMDYFKMFNYRLQEASWNITETIANFGNPYIDDPVRAKISQNVGTTDTTIKVASTVGFLSSGFLIIPKYIKKIYTEETGNTKQYTTYCGEEIIYYGSKTATEFRDCVRGKFGTTSTMEMTIPVREVESGVRYKIASLGDTNWQSMQVENANVGTVFTASSDGNGSGTVTIFGSTLDNNPDEKLLPGVKDPGKIPVTSSYQSGFSVAQFPIFRLDLNQWTNGTSYF